MEFSSDNYASLSQPYQNVVDGSPWVRSSIAHSFSYNSLDDQKQPREGFVASVTQEYAGLGGDSEYYKVYGRARYFHLLSDDLDLIGSIAVGGGHVWSTGSSLNVFDQFKLGGNQIRGFDTNGIGPRMSNGDVLGGTTYFTASAEMTFPFPGISPEAGLRGAFFADAGTLYGNSVDLGTDTAVGTTAAWRASVGASVIWASPFGPLRVDYAIPVKKASQDVVQRFKFGIQTNF
jgi:outer membrane protein insertion porin family